MMMSSKLQERHVRSSINGCSSGDAGATSHAVASDLSEQQTFTTLVAKLEEPLLRRATGLLRGDVQAAQDVVQASLVAVWEQGAVASFDNDSELRAYCYGVLVKQALAFKRSRFRRVRYEGDAGRLAHEQRLAAQPLADPLRVVAAAEAWERVAALPVPLRDVIELRFGMGLTLEETARHLGEPVGTVSTRQRNALALLRAQLGGREEATATQSEHATALPALAALPVAELLTQLGELGATPTDGAATTEAATNPSNNSSGESTTTEVEPGAPVVATAAAPVSHVVSVATVTALAVMGLLLAAFLFMQPRAESATPSAAPPPEAAVPSKDAPDAPPSVADSRPTRNANAPMPRPPQQTEPAPQGLLLLTVHDPKRKPIAEATVRIYESGDEPTTELTTDEHGNASWPLPTAELHALRLEAEAEGYERVERRLELEPATSHLIEIALGKPAPSITNTTVRGFVIRDPRDGAPLPHGVRLFLYGRSTAGVWFRRDTELDGHGGFEFTDVPPGLYTMHLEGIQPDREDPQIPGRRIAHPLQLVQQDDFHLEVSGDAEILDLEFILSIGEMTVRLVDETGQPITQGHVGMWPTMGRTPVHNECTCVMHFVQLDETGTGRFFYAMQLNTNKAWHIGFDHHDGDHPRMAGSAQRFEAPVRHYVMPVGKRPPSTPLQLVVPSEGEFGPATLKIEVRDAETHELMPHAVVNFVLTSSLEESGWFDQRRLHRRPTGIEQDGAMIRVEGLKLGRYRPRACLMLMFPRGTRPTRSSVKRVIWNCSPGSTP